MDINSMVAGQTIYIALQKGYSVLKNYHNSYNCILYLKVCVNIKYKEAVSTQVLLLLTWINTTKVKVQQKKVVSFLWYYFLLG